MTVLSFEILAVRDFARQMEAWAVASVVVFGYEKAVVVCIDSAKAGLDHLRCKKSGLVAG